MDDGQALARGSDIRDELVTAVERAARAGARRPHDGFRRIILRMPRVDPLRWLATQSYEDRFYWSGRSNGESVAGLGHAAVVDGGARVDYDALRQGVRRILASAPPGARLYGGVRFCGRRDPEPDWSAFPVYRFVLPRFELRRAGDSSVLICNVAPGESAGSVGLRSEIGALAAPAGTLPAIPHILSRNDLPDYRDWVRNVGWALEAFSTTTLAKVVLARMASLKLEGRMSPYALMSRLLPATPNCYHFLFAHGDTAFLGATPERLFKQDGRQIRSEAVAGTGPRGETEGADRALGDELLHSEKDQREHEYVRQSIKESLKDLTRILHVDTTASDMKLSVGRHLVSRVDGVLQPGVDTFDLLASLHPTPAVGGHPHQEAIDVIEHLESFDRGWYSGPVGWVGSDSAEFAVGIRSGRLRGRRLDLFSGAGIVGGSDPDREWEEVEQKIGDFLRVMTQ